MKLVPIVFLSKASRSFAVIVILAAIAPGVQHAFGWITDWSSVCEEFRLMKLSLLLLAVLGFVFFIVRGRMKRQAGLPVKLLTPDELVPLRDDVAENVSPARLRWLELCDHHFSELCKSVKRQMAARPNTWGVGLWPDEETEKIARKCAEIFADGSGGAALNLVPADPVLMIDALFDGDLEDVGALQEVEDTFRCKLPKDGYETMTFAQFIEHVRTTAGTQPPRDMRAERRGCLIQIARFIGMIAAMLSIGVAANIIGKSNGQPIGIGIGTLFVCWIATFVAGRFVKSDRARILLSQLCWAMVFAAIIYAQLPWEAIDCATGFALK